MPSDPNALTTTRVFSLDAGTVAFSKDPALVQTTECETASSYVEELVLGARIVITHTSRFDQARDAQMVRDSFPGLSLIEIMRDEEGAEMLRSLSHGLGSIDLGVLVLGEPAKVPSPLSTELSKMTSRCDDQHPDECAKTLEALYALARDHLLSRKPPTAEAYGDWAILSARLRDWTPAE